MPCRDIYLRGRIWIFTLTRDEESGEHTQPIARHGRSSVRGWHSWRVVRWCLGKRSKTIPFIQNLHHKLRIVMSLCTVIMMIICLVVFCKKRYNCCSNIWQGVHFFGILKQIWTGSTKHYSRYLSWFFCTSHDISAYLRVHTQIYIYIYRYISMFDTVTFYYYFLIFD